MNFDYCEGKIHVVKAGDSLYSISRMHKVPLGMVLRANPYVDVYNLQVGDEICVPMPKPMPGPGPGPVRPPQEPQEPEVMDYLTVEGDNVQSVLDAFKISLEDLMEHNELEDLQLNPGTRLKIPRMTGCS